MRNIVKKIFVCLLILSTMSAMADNPSEEYVDLGLPSGTKWKKSNEQGLYTYLSAKYYYNDALPNRAQVKELLYNCTWKWTGKGYRVTGPNQNSIYFPFNGYKDCDEDLHYDGSATILWTLDHAGSEWAYVYVLSDNQREILEEANCWSCSVRLVKNEY